MEAPVVSFLISVFYGRWGNLSLGNSPLFTTHRKRLGAAALSRIRASAGIESKCFTIPVGPAYSARRPSLPQVPLPMRIYAPANAHTLCVVHP